MRNPPLVNYCVYHVCTKSIAGFKIFRNQIDYSRMIDMLWYYSYERPPMRFSFYRILERRGKEGFLEKELSKKEFLVELIAYCLMPTHMHLILAQLKDEGISLFMKNLLNSYTRYFNIRNGRVGPLWQGRFKSILIQTDEQLLHLTRYIHLNPTSESLVDKPEKWKYSSYHEYLNPGDENLCNFLKYIKIDPNSYRKFIEERKNYQRILTGIKHLCLE